MPFFRHLNSKILLQVRFWCYRYRLIILYHHLISYFPLLTAVISVLIFSNVIINRRNEFIVILYNKPISNEQETPLSLNKGKEGLLEFCKTPRTRQEIADYLGINTVFYVMKHYIQPLVESGELLLTLPDKPRSRNQQFVSKKSE